MERQKPFPLPINWPDSVILTSRIRQKWCSVASQNRCKEIYSIHFTCFECSLRSYPYQEYSSLLASERAVWRETLIHHGHFSHSWDPRRRNIQLSPRQPKESWKVNNVGIWWWSSGWLCASIAVHVDLILVRDLRSHMCWWGHKSIIFSSVLSLSFG